MARGKKGLANYAIKCKLKSICKFPQFTDIIRKRVIETNKLMTEAYYLFNLYVMSFIDIDAIQSIDYSTIERCALLVLGNDNFRNRDILENKRIDDEVNRIISLQNIPDVLPIEHKYDHEQETLCMDYELMLLKTVFKKLYHPSKFVTDLSTIKSVTRPIEYFSRDMMGNLKVHTTTRFWLFQKKYIKHKVIEKFKEYKLSKNLLISITNCIQGNINSDKNQIYVKSKKLKKHPEFNAIGPLIIDLVKSEKKFVPVEKDSIIKVLKYYHFMLSYLEENEFKRFSLLPQLNLGLSHVKFDSRLLCVMYNDLMDQLAEEVKETSIKKVQDKYNFNFGIKNIPIKKFEANYKEYYKRIFNLKPFKFQKKNKHNLISISTDSYSACLLFEKVKPIKEKQSKEDKKNKIIEKIDLTQKYKNKKFIRGLYDSDNCKASSEYIDTFHKIGIDPNNKIMLYCVDENGKSIKISKGYFNEVSHITRNNKKVKNMIKEHNMKEIYDELGETKFRKTLIIKQYSGMILVIRKYWDQIWNFYSMNKYQKLNLDTYINRKKAIHKIVRKIVPKNKEDKKPIMVAFGKGNGSTTIGNLRNSSPKGPIKAVAKELSDFCLTILTDEYNTSKYCSKCEASELDHPMETRNKYVKRKVEEKSIRIKETVTVKSHRLCICKNGNHTADGKCSHNLWNRDYNAARNILNVMRKKITGEELGIFKRGEEEALKNHEITVLLKGETAAKLRSRSKVSLRTKTSMACS